MEASEELGMRMMLDLDILVPEDRLEESVAVLRHLEYERCGNSHLQVTHPHTIPLYSDLARSPQAADGGAISNLAARDWRLDR